MTISPRLLLAIYLVIPLCLVLTFAMQIFGANHLLTALPETPNELIIFTLFFVLPHIVASSNTMLDKSYIAFYKNKLLIALFISIMIAFLLPRLIDPMIVLVINGALTVYHVIAQQFGLTASLSRAKTTIYQVWKYSGIALGGFIFYLFYYSKQISPEIYQGYRIVVFILLLLFGVLTYFSQKDSKTKEGKIYHWLNFLMLCVTFYYIDIKLLFFAMIITRIIHDLTAFSFYIVHDYNRNNDNPKNVIYKILGSIIPLYIATPIIAIIMAKSISLLEFLTFINFITIFHYCTESFIWKTGTLHRKYIKFSS